MRETDWINDTVVKFVADALIEFAKDQTEHEKIRIYINDRSQSVNIVSLTTGDCFIPEGDQELSKDSSTHLGIIHEFHRIERTPNWAFKVAKEALELLEPRF
ncbi:hypothetical protein [Vibrio cholerae]|uniref:hypothetical protein n=1 Tax=Vibrio cholerae TaxID=666 RepID=UPI0004E3BD2C|nr:hypothetical protein [Vibrio cholerae]KFE28819.1 hypothetical protein DN30_308 [Vibrio cholerae]MDX5049958.1 hypothetical protein [Vibrio cholerae]TXY44021.1 hypothetical protein FXE84_01395 [Vibrio cholerae]